MLNIKVLLSFGLILVYYQSISQKNFVIQETNIDSKKLSQCLSTARRCEAVLLKNSPSTSLVFSENSTLTNNAINSLSENFMSAYPKSKPSSYQDPIIERLLLREKPNALRLTYCFLPQDKKSTTDYVQMTVIFDASPNPKIVDILVKSKAQVGVITLTEREMLKFKTPEIQVQAPKETQSTTTPKAATKKPASKTSQKSQPKAPLKTTPKPQPKAAAKTPVKTPTSTPTKK